MIEAEPIEFRAGIGTDIHRLVEGRKLMLGGLQIPHQLGLLGHSDGDVALHAVVMEAYVHGENRDDQCCARSPSPDGGSTNPSGCSTSPTWSGSRTVTGRIGAHSRCP